jgi:hypothetical protein
LRKWGTVIFERQEAQTDDVKNIQNIDFLGITSESRNVSLKKSIKE